MFIIVVTVSIVIFIIIVVILLLLLLLLLLFFLLLLSSIIIIYASINGIDTCLAQTTLLCRTTIVLHAACSWVRHVLTAKEARHLRPGADRRCCRLQRLGGSASAQSFEGLWDLNQVGPRLTGPAPKMMGCIPYTLGSRAIVMGTLMSRYM